MNRKFIVDEKILRELNLLCFCEGLASGIMVGGTWRYIELVKEEEL